MLFPTSVEIPFAASVLSNDLPPIGKVGLTIYVSVVRVPFGGGANTVLVSLASNIQATEVDPTNQPGLYRYLLSSSNTGTPGYYFCYFHPTSTAVQSQCIEAMEIVGAAWVQTASGAMQAGNVTVGSYAAGQSPASLLLATPANKLATDGSGQVVASSVVGAVASVAADVGITQAGADKVWASSYSSFNAVGSIGKFLADMIAAVNTFLGKIKFSGANNVQVDVQQWGGATPIGLSGGLVQTTAPTAGAIDTQLTASHGPDSWQQGNTLAPANTAILDAIDELHDPLDADATADAVQAGLDAQGYTSARATKLSLIGAVAVTYQGPTVGPGQFDFDITRGDSYTVATQQRGWTESTGAWAGYVGKDAVFTAAQGNSSVSSSVAFAWVDEEAGVVSATITALTTAQTKLLGTGKWDFDVQVQIADGVDFTPILGGVMTVVKDVSPPST